MIIDHIGIVVRSIDNAIEQWALLFGYQQMTEPVINSRQKVKVVFLQKENSLLIKLIEPVEDSSPVFSFAQKGGGLHHLCFKCDDINDELPRAGHLHENNPMDIQSIQNVEIKDKIKVLYTDIDGNYGVCYNTLKEIIELIPAEEISEDIVSMYRYIKNKVEN